MPWEIDYALLTFTQLKKSKYYLPEGVNITVESVLNLSSYLINWEESKVPKEFFIEKYNQISLLLNDYNHIKRTYDGDQLYGHLNMQRECISAEVDYYINICPDMYFSEYLLYYLAETISTIKDKYFVLSPQHRKLSDPTWDPTTDPDYLHIPYSEYNNVDVFDIRYNNKQKMDNISVEQSVNGKYAGWFDLHNKSFYEQFMPSMPEWHGYGPWDFFGMNMANFAISQYKTDVQQYVLRNQIVCERNLGVFQKKLSPNIYKKYLKLNLSLSISSPKTVLAGWLMTWRARIPSSIA